jgi:hypothetical protein
MDILAGFADWLFAIKMSFDKTAIKSSLLLAVTRQKKLSYTCKFY